MNSEPRPLQRPHALPTSFNGRMVPHSCGSDHGTRCVGSTVDTIANLNRNHERIANEAKALKLVAEQTKIPVPRLIHHGTHPDGSQFLVTERIDGITLNRFAGCSGLEGIAHISVTADTPTCKTCLEKGYHNALEFIQITVLPQLAALRSKERGLDGFVMPPSWIYSDIQPPWIGKKPWKTLPLKDLNYVFTHGDLAAHNIMIDRDTLKVKALIDWEFAGYFLPGMERWSLRENHSDHFCQADAIGKFLPFDYLEFYEDWEEKAKLEPLIEHRELPDPVQLRRALEGNVFDLRDFTGVGLDIGAI